MKKILFLLTILASITYGQAKQSIPDTLRTHRTEINLHADTLTALRTDVGTNTTDIALRATLASPTFTGTVTIPTINITSAFKIGGTTITPSATELNYVDGVTSSIQAQLDTLTASLTDIESGTGFLPKTGTLTGITSDLTASSGTWTPYILDPTTLKIKNGTPAVTDELSYDDGQDETGLYIKTAASTLYVPDEQVIDAKLKQTDFIAFSDNYPQLNDYQGLRWSFDVQIDSVIASIQSTGATGTMAFNVWHGSVYSPSIGEHYVFSSTQTITQENTETPNTYNTGWSTRNVDAGSFLWVQYSTMTGTIEKFFITVYYTRL